MNAQELVSESQVAYLKDNTPNAGRLVLALRETAGYNPYTVLADLVDNSIDAECKNIRIFIRQRNKKSQIVIADDGYGMDEDTLQEALRLGSNLEKDKISDLGCFGMGLKVASFAIGKKLSILTLEKGGEWHKAVLDINKIVELDQWVISTPPTDWEDVEIIEESCISDHGTIVVVDDLDKFPISVTTQTADIAKKRMARIFWKKIYDGVKIQINGDEVEAYDPLEWEDWVLKKIATPRVEPEEGDIEVEFEYDGEKKTGTIHYRCMSFPERDEIDPNKVRRDKVLPTNNRTCGIYVYRNNREIAHGTTLDCYQKHTTHHSMRMAIYFKAHELDSGIGTNNNKSNIDPDKISKSIKDKLSEEIFRPFASKVYKACVTERLENTADGIQEVHDAASERIREKSKGLALPTLPQSKEKRDTGDGKGTVVPKNTGRSRGLGVNRQSGKLGEVEYQSAKMGRGGQLYEADKVDRKLVVIWNSEHPVYLDASRDKKMMRILDFMVHAMASAEVGYMYGVCDELEGSVDPIETIIKFKMDLSNNLRILVGE